MSITAKHPQAVDAVPEATDQEVLTDEERRQRQIELNQPVIALIESWIEEDMAAGEDDREAFEEFKRNIDAVRLPGSKLFS